MSNVVELLFFSRACREEFCIGNVKQFNITNNPTNETWMCDSDCVEFQEFLNQLFLAMEILYILISILIILGNTLVLLASWIGRTHYQPNKYFIPHRALADFLVGIFIGPVTVHGLWIMNRHLTFISAVIMVG